MGNMLPVILKIMRTEKGISQKDLAKYLNVDRSTYTKYESGDSAPNYDKLIKLADYFEISIDNLLGRGPQYDHSLGGGALLDLTQVVTSDLIHELASREEIQKISVGSDKPYELREKIAHGNLRRHISADTVLVVRGFHYVDSEDGYELSNQEEMRKVAQEALIQVCGLIIRETKKETAPEDFLQSLTGAGHLIAALAQTHLLVDGI